MKHFTLTACVLLFIVFSSAVFYVAHGWAGVVVGWMALVLAGATLLPLLGRLHAEIDGLRSDDGSITFDAVDKPQGGSSADGVWRPGTIEDELQVTDEDLIDAGLARPDQIIDIRERSTAVMGETRGVWA